MLFNSEAFAVFLPCVLVVYWLLRRPSHQNLLLVGASLFFYGWWDWRFLSLIVISTIVDYTCGLRIASARNTGRRGRAWLITSMCVNLGILCTFKYYGFFVESARALWDSIGWQPGLIDVVLPVGISFYTFQTMSYTIDIYRGTLEPTRSLVNFATFVMFFPQLVAGPIERAGRLLPQFEAPRILNRTQVQAGLLLLLSGFFKKMVIADGIAPVVNVLFDDLSRGENIGAGNVLCVMWAFSLQIYGDFSGYSDIARGVAKLLGVNLMINFRQPFFAVGLVDLWRRWHISLSEWFRDYVYLPLRGNRVTFVRTQWNTLVTMTVSGLWHGAGWTFVIWGALHGLFLIAQRMLVRVGLRLPSGSAGRVVGVLVTFQLTSLAFLVFRADSIVDAYHAFQIAVTSPALPDTAVLWSTLLAGALVFLVDLPYVLDRGEEREPTLVEKPAWTFALCAVAGASFYVLPVGGAQTFIYFAF